MSDPAEEPTTSNAFRLTGRQWMGFGYSNHTSSVERITGLSVPSWFLVVLFAAVPLRWFVLRRRRATRPPGACATCGYDLRATPDRCPECGSVPQPIEGAAA